jgi:hypothetical protein
MLAVHVASREAPANRCGNFIAMGRAIRQHGTTLFSAKLSRFMIRNLQIPVRWLAALFLLSAAPLYSQDAIISEFMASNVTELADEDGQFSDWIEVENPGGVPVNLEGWSLTDNAAQPAKWRFPAMTLPPAGRVVVFASGKNRAVAGRQLHTNFGLKSEGGYLALVRPDGSARPSEWNPYPLQQDDISFGAAQETVPVGLLGGSAGRLLVAAGGAVPPADWTSAGFAGDGGWRATATPPGIGYDTTAPAPPPGNIARTGTAVQSTTQGSFTAALGNDGILNNFTQTGTADAAPFWNLDLGGIAQISSITVRKRGDNCCGSRLRDITVQILDEALAPIYTSALLNPENAGFTYPAGPASLSIDLVALTGGSLAGRHVRISRTADPDLSGTGGQGDVNEQNVLSMGEVEVFGVAPGIAVNLARTGSPAPVATQTSTLSTYTAALGINGNSADFTHTLSTDVNPAWTLNLNRRAAIASVNLHNREGCCPERLRNITIQILDANGTTVLHTSALLNPENVLGGPADLFYDVSAANGGNPVFGQYVRVRRTPDAAATDDARVLSLGEVQVRGTELNGYRPHIRTDVEAEMLGKASTVYWRLPFTAANAARFNALVLRMRYDDGFVAWLNGTKIAERNAPADPGPGSVATANRPFTEGIVAETIDAAAVLPLLNPAGPNVLAVQGLNVAASDDNFLLQPELAATYVNTTPNVYLTNATPGAPNATPWFEGEVEDTKFSHRRGFYDVPFQLSITTATPGSQIWYTTNNSEPSPQNGTLYSGPITIGSTPNTSTSGARVIRARAFRTNWKPTNIDTHTFIFPADVTGPPKVSLSTGGAVTGSVANIPPGWPTNAATNGGQAFIWGFDSVVKSQYSAAQMREALGQIPVISVVTQQNHLTDPVTGIYVNGVQRGQAWERPASIEMLDLTKPGATPEAGHGQFGSGCGIRIRGGASRGDSSTKHSFRVFFRNAYGDGKLNYRLYGPDGAAEYDAFDLRGSQNYSWSQNASDVNETMVRDPFCRMTLAAMGQPSTRTRYCHLFLNGLYWGIYDIHERAENSFGETYLGGNQDDYDVIKCGDRYTLDFKTEATDGYLTTNPDGSKAAWRDLWDRSIAHRTAPTNANYFRMLGRNPDGTRNPAFPVLVDIDDLIDYMMVIFYTGDGDAVLSSFLSNNKPNNWHSMRDRKGERGFTFYLQDGEHTLLAPNWGVDRTGPFLTQSNSTLPDWSNPQWIHDSLALNPEYRLRFADRVRRHFFNGGAMTAPVAKQRWLDKAAGINRAIRLYSARYSNSSTGESAWNTRINFIRDNFFDSRPAVVLAQFTADRLWPSVAAPDFSQHGGQVPGGYPLVINAPPGARVYYTTDGTDPRRIVESVPTPNVFSPANAAMRWRVPASADDGFTIGPPPPPVTDGLAARWRLDGNGDDAVGGFTAVPAGGPAYTTGQNGQAISLNGSSQYLSVGNPAGLQITGQITMAAWIRPTASTNIRNILSKGFNTAPNGEVSLRISAGALEVGTWDGASYFAGSPAAVVLNQWQHVCGVFDGSAWRLYRNGEEIANLPTTQGAVAVAGATAVNNAWSIGSRGGSTERAFAGQIDEVFLYRRGLTPAEVRGLWQGTQPSVTDPEWSKPDYAAPAAWQNGTGGIGYDTNPTVSFLPWIGTNVETAMLGVSPTVLTRREFTLSSAQIGETAVLQLAVRYDDGFVAYLNGVKVAERNAPAVSNGASAATTVRADAQAIVPERIDISNFIGVLREGRNVLAFQALNATAADNDLLLEAELQAGGESAFVGEGARRYTGPVTLTQPGTIRARVFSNGQWSAMTEAFFSVATEPASASNLVISELHYNPLPPVTAGELAVSVDAGDFEFLELMNIRPASAVDLTGIRFTGGVTTSPLGNVVLQPGERAVLVSNPAAFAARYGTAFAGARVLGAYSGSLSNQGEPLVLNAADGSVIRDFVYDDNAPWPEEADGQGPSLVLVAPAANPDHGLPQNWTSSSAAGGTPGTSAWLAWAAQYGVTDAVADLDGDGAEALLEYALGTDPGKSSPASVSAGVAPDGYLTVSVTHAAAEDVVIEPQQSVGLESWTGGMIPVSRVPDGAGRFTSTWRTTEPVGAGLRRFVRIKATLR